MMCECHTITLIFEKSLSEEHNNDVYIIDLQAISQNASIAFWRTFICKAQQLCVHHSVLQAMAPLEARRRVSVNLPLAVVR